MPLTDAGWAVVILACHETDAWAVTIYRMSAAATAVKDTGEFVCEREIVWRGTRRTAEFVFANVCDPEDLRDEQFHPTVDGRLRFILDYPFDQQHKYPSDDAGRVRALVRDGVQASTIVWLPHSPPREAGSSVVC